MQKTAGAKLCALGMFILLMGGCDMLSSASDYFDSLSAGRRTANEITAFRLLKPDGSLFCECRLDESAGEIIAIVPVAPTAESLIALFSLSGGSITVGGLPQVSGVTQNVFFAPSAPLIFTVTAYDGSVREYAATFLVVPPVLDVTVTTPDYSDADMHLNYSLSGGSILFTADPGYDDYRWYVDGTPLSGAAGNSCTLQLSSYTPGKYTLMLIVTRGGDLFSATCSFTVRRTP